MQIGCVILNWDFFSIGSRSRERDRVRDYDRRDREVVHPDNYNHGQSSRDVGVSNVQQQHLNNRGLSNRPSIDGDKLVFVLFCHI